MSYYENYEKTRARFEIIENALKQNGILDANYTPPTIDDLNVNAMLNAIFSTGSNANTQTTSTGDDNLDADLTQFLTLV